MPLLCFVSGLSEENALTNLVIFGVDFVDF